MVPQHMSHKCKDKQAVLEEKKERLLTTVDLNECLQQIK